MGKRHKRDILIERSVTQTVAEAPDGDGTIEDVLMSEDQRTVIKYRPSINRSCAFQEVVMNRSCPDGTREGDRELSRWVDHAEEDFRDRRSALSEYSKYENAIENERRTAYQFSGVELLEHGTCMLLDPWLRHRLAADEHNDTLLTSLLHSTHDALY